MTAAPDESALRMLRQARDRIDRDYAEPVGIPALAAAAGYSTTHFIRAFRAAYGETPGAYRTRRRVERACGRNRVARKNGWSGISTILISPAPPSPLARRPPASSRRW